VSETLSNLLHEVRKFRPSAEFAAQANVSAEAYEDSARDRLGFWEAQARRLQWAAPWNKTLEWERPFAKWFVGGKLNASVNCLDRHVAAGNGDRTAILFEGEPGDTATLTYAELLTQVSKAANALTELGVTAGDRELVITGDGGYRRGSVSALKPAVDEALDRGANNVQHMLVVRRGKNEVAWTEGRDLWWDEVVAKQPDTHEAPALDSENPLFILYTSGTTGKPKGILHTTGGYLTQVSYTHSAVFDLKPESDVYWCTADIGWVTGHSYIVYGPLSNGATVVLYEGTPDTPHRGRFWEIVQKYGVTILYTAPTAIPTFMKWGEDVPRTSSTCPACACSAASANRSTPRPGSGTAG